MFSCLINIALDILLVVMCGLGVKGAAIATILSQLLSAVLVCICLMRAQDMYRLEWKQVRLDQNAETDCPNWLSRRSAVCDVRIFQCDYPGGNQFPGNQYGGCMGGYSKIDADSG